MPFLSTATTLLLLITTSSVHAITPIPINSLNSLIVSPTNNQLYLIDIQQSYPSVDWSTLDRLYIEAGQYKFIRIGNLPNRNASRPLIITNINGQVRVGGLDHYYLLSLSGGTNWILTGKYDPISMTGDSNFTGHGGGGGDNYANSQGTYGIYVDDEFRTFGTGNSGIAVGSKVPESQVNSTVPYPITSDFEISFCEITKVGFAGMTIKSDGLKQTILDSTGYTISNYTMNNVYIHDNYIHDIGSEGIYLGSTQSQSEQHAFNHLSISNNRILRTGTEGLQVGQLGDGCEIHNNVVALSAIDWKDAFQTYQDNSLQVTFRYGQSSVHHNIFIGAGDSIISLQALNAVGDVHSSGDSITIHDNFLSSSRFLGMYMGQKDQPTSTTTQSIADGITTYRFINNTFREFVFGRDEIYGTSPNEDLIRMNYKFTNPIELDGNILDTDGLDHLYLAKFAYSSKLGSSTDTNVTLNGESGYITAEIIAEKGLVGSGNITASNNVRGNVDPVTFQNFLPGIPADVAYLSIERWANYSHLNWQQVYYNQGDYVLHRGNVYRSIQEDNNTGVQPDLEDSCDTWMLLPSPVDDVRLACGSAHQGVGLLDTVSTCSACAETGTSCAEDADCCSGNCDNTGEPCQEPPTFQCLVQTPGPTPGPTPATSTTETCGIQTVLHRVDQSKTKCKGDRVGKASCSMALSSTIEDQVQVTVMAMPENYSPKNNQEYFDNATLDPNFPPVSASNNDSLCIIHPALSSTGEYLALACWDDVCASKKVNTEEGGVTKIKFMELTNKDTAVKRVGANSATKGNKKRRKNLRALFLEEEDDALTVLFPQYFIWDNTTEYYPMVFISNTKASATIDVCLYEPEGYVLVAALDVEADELQDLQGVCTHVIIPGAEIVLLLETVADQVVDDQEEGGGGRKVARLSELTDPDVSVEIFAHLSPAEANIFDHQSDDDFIITATIPGVINFSNE